MEKNLIRNHSKDSAFSPLRADSFKEYDVFLISHINNSHILLKLGIEIEFSQLYTGPDGVPHEKLVECLKLKKHDNKISLAEILAPFKEKGFNFNSYMFLYFSKSQQIYTYCGCSNNSEISFISLNDITDNLIKIRCRKSKTQPVLRDSEDFLQQEFQHENKPQESTSALRRGKRTKERRIREIVNKVTEWRKLYTGIRGSDGNLTKYSLEEAAAIVGIAKKTLDDYLLQLRFGKKYGFDFNLYKDEKVGTLRTFVKEQKAKEKISRSGIKREDEESKSKDNSEISDYDN